MAHTFSKRALRNLLEQFLNAPTWNHTRAFLEHNVELMTDAGERELAELARMVSPADQPVVVQHLNFVRRSRRVGINAAFEEAMTSVYVLGAPTESRRLLQKAAECAMSFHDTSRPEDLRKGIQILEQVLSAEFISIASDIVVAGILSDLSNWGYCLFDRESEATSMSRTIELSDQVLLVKPSDSLATITAIHALGRALRCRYLINGDLDDLNRAIAIIGKFLQVAHLNSDAHASLLNILSGCLQSRFEVCGNPEDLDDAVDAASTGLRLGLNKGNETLKLQTLLGNGLLLRFQASSCPTDLKQAMELLATVASISSGDALSHGNLGNAFWHKYKHTGNADDLEHSISCSETALKLSTPTARHVSGFNINLGTALIHRSELTGSSSDAQRAVLCFEAVVKNSDDNSPQFCRYLGNLANALVTLHSRSANPQNLYKAIEYYEKAIAKCPERSPHRLMLHDGLGLACKARFDYTGRIHDLSLAVEQSELAVSQAGIRSGVRARVLSNHAIILKALYERRSDESLLDAAMSDLRQAISIVSESSPEYLAYVNNLGTTLRDRFQKSQDFGMLNEAIDCFRKVVTGTGDRSTLRPTRLNNLANALRDRFELSCNAADLDEAIQLLEAAVSASSESSTARPLLLGNLAFALENRHRLTGTKRDFDSLLAAYRAAGQSGLHCSVEHALKNAVNWTSWAFGRGAWEEVREAYAGLREASRRLFQMQVRRSEKESWLRYSRGVTAAVMFSLCRLGHAEEAIAAVEEMRARLLSEAIQTVPRELIELEFSKPDLFERYSDIVRRLRHFVQRESESAAVSDDVIQEIDRLRDSLISLTAEIRAIPGLEGFLEEPTVTAVRSAFLDPADKDCSALVYLATTMHGSVALIVLGDTTRIIWPSLDEMSLRSQLIEPIADGKGGGYLAGQFGDSRQIPPALKNLLPELGERLMSPIVKSLQDAAVARATLVPVGQLGLLPLHAATWQHNGETKCVLDEVCINYAPNAHCLNRPAARTGDADPILFAVANPLPNPRPLRGAKFEVEQVSGVFPGRIIALYGERASRSAVLDRLPGATHLHFACHGTFDVETPSKSHLMLAGTDTLSLNDFITRKADVSGVRLVVLSACQTSVTDPVRLPDEVIGFPAAFLEAGVSAVIGSLWPVNDTSTALLMLKFYRCLGRPEDVKASVDRGRFAHALRQAQIWLRDVTSAEAGNWLKASSSVSSQEDSDLKLPNDAEHPFSHPCFWAAFQLIGA